MFGLLIIIDLMKNLDGLGGEALWGIWRLLVAIHFLSASCFDFFEYATGSEEDRKTIRLQIAKASAETAGNLIVVLPLLIFAFLFFLPEKRNEFELTYSRPDYSVLEVVKIVFYFTAFRLWFVFSHSALHASEWLRLHVHSVHHFYVDTIAADALAMHPLEFLFVMVVGCLIGPFLWAPSSAGVFCFYLCLSAVLNCLVHSRLSRYIHLGNHVMHHKKQTKYH